MKRPSIEPVVWKPPPAPRRARSKASDPPAPVPRLIPVGGHGPEDVVVDDSGRIYTGVDDGRIVRLIEDGASVETVAETGGYPLGIELAPDGTLVVCDCRRGLLRVDPDRGSVQTLVDVVDGQRLRLCNNGAVARDGTAYFTDSSRRFPREDYEADLIEHSGTGRLLRRDPSGAVEVLLDGLQFSNGVALAPDESFVLFAETGAYRITKLWLTGDRSGQTDTFAENLPGFPDNISTGPSGLIWVALPSPRNPMLDRLLPLPPIFRRMAWGLPDPLRPRAERTMWVMAFDLDGRPVHDLQRGGDRYRMVTGVREYGGRVYLGSIDEDAVAVLDLPTGHKATHPPSRP